uniref:Uncharacterized protein n=1 Tax=Timspurckia oligopyrenoides TaxID=708627 RepID=A0A7S1ERW2_9RHOD
MESVVEERFKDNVNHAVSEVRDVLHREVYRLENGTQLLFCFRSAVENVSLALSKQKLELEEQCEDLISYKNREDLYKGEVSVSLKILILMCFVQMQQCAQNQLHSMLKVSWNALVKRVSSTLCAKFERELRSNFMCPFLNPNMRGASKITQRLSKKYAQEFKRMVEVEKVKTCLGSNGESDFEFRVDDSELMEKIDEFSALLMVRSGEICRQMKPKLLTLQADAMKGPWWKKPVHKKLVGVLAKIAFSVIAGLLKSRASSENDHSIALIQDGPPLM